MTVLFFVFEGVFSFPVVFRLVFLFPGHGRNAPYGAGAPVDFLFCLAAHLFARDEFFHCVLLNVYLCPDYTTPCNTKKGYFQ